MALSESQIKGRIKNIAKSNNADARVLLRIYMMEHFLERLSKSNYSDNFIIKGGILVTSMVGISLRSTMDIDTTIRNFELSKDEAVKIVSDICSIDINDNVTYEIKDVSHIMDDMDYPGIRLTLDASIGKMIVPIKIDISTGDVITPEAIEYEYEVLLENRSIRLWTYNLETILAEKLQTILSRGTLNTRMRDFYDIHILLLRFKNHLNKNIFREAFIATCKKRETTGLLTEGDKIIEIIMTDEGLSKLWTSYQNKYSYAEDISYQSIMESVSWLYYQK